MKLLNIGKCHLGHYGAFSKTTWTCIRLPPNLCHACQMRRRILSAHARTLKETYNSFQRMWCEFMGMALKSSNNHFSGRSQNLKIKKRETKVHSYIHMWRAFSCAPLPTCKELSIMNLFPKGKHCKPTFLQWHLHEFLAKTNMTVVLHPPYSPD
jgi:hypothetical protein